MKRIVLLLATMLTVRAEVTLVDRPDPAGGISNYPANRAPLQPSPLVRLPMGAVRPQGWVKRTLELQGAGFHGHLPEISGFLKTTNNAWLSPIGVGERGWEEVPYWLKGFIGCAYLREDATQIAEAHRWIEGALKSQQPDGWFGPDKGRTGVATDLKGRDDLWPNMIMLFCLQTYYERTADPRVLELMTKYFRYLAAVPEEKFLVGYWPSMRGGDQLYSILWLYNRTGDAWLLDLARRTHAKTARWDTTVPNWHNVNIAQAFREPAIFWMLTGDPAHLAATERVWSEVRRLYGQVPGGMYGADENARPGFNGPRQAIETCGVAEEMLSDGLLLEATGDPVWAARCENAAFNTMPATMTADLKALRYLTAPNQPQSDHANKAPAIQNGGNMFEMNPHDHRCCQHNSGHAWPYFTQHLWYAAPGNGLAAMLYGPCEVTAKVADGVEARIVETTRYPFEERIEFVVSLPKPAKFPLLLRIPAWCDGAKLSVAGEDAKLTGAAGRIARIERTWRDGDSVVLDLPMHAKAKTWTGNRGFVSVDRGPLTYSVQIKEEYRRHGGTDTWPAWDIYPASPWNYGLELTGDDAKDFTFVPGAWPADDQPFRAIPTPGRLLAHVRKIPNWTLDARGAVNELIDSPVKSAEPVELITLIPMGAARLRITAFPRIGNGPDAHTWPDAAKPPFQVSASHCFESDTTDALWDGVLPKSSSDHSLPRFTWWPQRGSTEWVQAVFEKPRKVSAVSVYWFDDEPGHGQCRVPQSWRLLYKQGDTWTPVAGAATYPTDKDRLHRVTFDAVETTALRIEAVLRPTFSGGLLEWRIE